MSVKAAVVIPTHKAEINEFEKISLVQCRKVLGNYPLIFVAPEGANFPYFAAGDMVAHFPPQFFQSVRGYNILMMSPFFYETFKDFDYILIYEPDAFVFRDELEYFCSLGYDYIGAPWTIWADWIRQDWKNLSRVGNSGFCLRNVKAHYKLLSNYADFVNRFRGINNDNFFSRCGKIPELNFHVAPYDVACRFSMEVMPERILKKNGGTLPFGCHKWFGSSADLYIQIFQKLGYDLRPLKDKMKSGNYEEALRKTLIDEATRRLERRLQRGHSLMRYLPRRDFASVRVIRHPFTMMILARLILEEPSLADKIFLYDHDEQDLLLNDLTLQKQPHLLIDAVGEGYDTNLISAVEQRGFVYGKRVVSFWREYLTYCEKLFHSLGKN